MVRAERERGIFMELILAKYLATSHYWDRILIHIKAAFIGELVMVCEVCAVTAVTCWQHVWLSRSILATA